MEPPLLNALVTGARTLGVEPTRNLVDGLGRYLSLLELWNRSINLSAVRDPAGIVEKHFLDSLAVLPHVPAGTATLVDVGSGAGFPGAVVALARPEVAVTLVESNHKKAAFLSTVKRELGLGAVTVTAARVEAMTASAAFRPFDVAVSRATFALPEWLALARTLVRASGGLVLGMEGAEQHPLPAGATRHPYPLAGAERAIVRWAAGGDANSG